MSDTLLVDTGFWIAYFDPREGDRHKVANDKADVLNRANLLIPWPIQYEILRTRFVKRIDWIVRFDAILKRSRVEFLDDSGYREEAYRQTLEYSTARRPRPMSMVDVLCRIILDDPAYQIKYLLTMNPVDFHDVCRPRGIEML